jgi:preprotein translocase subunit SecY
MFVIITMVLTMTAGTGFIMWLGELVTEKGIGNGMSLLIFTSIAPASGSLWDDPHPEGLPDLPAGDRHRHGASWPWSVFVEQSQRRVPVQYASDRSAGRPSAGPQYLFPIKVNMAGVIPVIFASSLLYLPALLAQFQRNSTAAWVDWVNTNLVRGDHPIYMVSYFLLIVFFTYFYVAITFNPDEVAENMKKVRRVHPGYPGGPADRGLPSNMF